MITKVSSAQSIESVKEKKDGLKGKWRVFFLILATVFVLYHLLYLSDLLVTAFAICINPYWHDGIHLSMVLFFVFLLIPAKKNISRPRPPWYDIILAVLALVPSGYFAFFYESEISSFLGLLRPLYVIFGWWLIILLLEASRRLLGWTFVGLVAFFVIYTAYCNYFPGILHGSGYSLSKVGEFMYGSRGAIHGIPLHLSATVIVTFLIFSQLLYISGMGKFVIDLGFSVAGRFRGGPAKAAVIASAGFGMLSATPSGNVATTGSFTIPMMKRLGYKPEFAGAIEAVASTGGMIMPPIMASVVFIMSEYVEIPYFQLIVCLFVPACLYYLALLIMVDTEAIRLRLHGVPKNELPQFMKILRQGFVFIIPVAMLLFLLMVPMYAPHKAAIGAMLSLIILTWFRKEGRIGLKSFINASEKLVLVLLQVAVACAAVGIIIGSVSLTGLGVRMSTELVAISGGILSVLLLLSAATSFVMGMGVGSISCYIFLAVLVAPAMIRLGVLPISAHLFIIYWGVVSFITPPVCMAVFVASGIAESNIMKTGWTAVRLGITAFIVPFAFVYKPALLLQGSSGDIIMTIISCGIGIVAIAYGLGDYFLTRLSRLSRALLLVGGSTLLFTDGIYLIGGGAMVALVIVWQLMIRRHSKTPHT